jgi:hypothetical protein
MKEFLEALGISLAFVLGGYFLFGGLGKVQPGAETMNMDMSGMDMTSESNSSTEGMGSMPGMSH